jgi:hypothetical protein
VTIVYVSIAAARDFEKARVGPPVEAVNCPIATVLSADVAPSIVRRAFPIPDSALPGVPMYIRFEASQRAVSRPLFESAITLADTLEKPIPVLLRNPILGVAIEPSVNWPDADTRDAAFKPGTKLLVIQAKYASMLAEKLAWSVRIGVVGGVAIAIM